MMKQYCATSDMGIAPYVCLFPHTPPSSFSAPAKLSVFKLMTWVGGSISCEGPLATSGTLTLESGVELTITRDGGVKVRRMT